MTLTIQDALAHILQRIDPKSDTPILVAQVLLAYILGKPRTWVMAHPDHLLNSQQLEGLNHAVHRLDHGEPLPYLIGHWEFFGLDFYLTQDVLIPRPETELLVERGIEWLQLHPQRRKAIDVGTGSGCIGIALAMHIPDLLLLLTDISPFALEVARINAEQYSLFNRVEFQQADLLTGIYGSFDLICANLPYIPSRSLKQLEVARREPWQALDGGEDGINILSRLLDQGRNFLTPGGLMLLEIEASQGEQVQALAHDLYPAAKIKILQDLAGRDRCLQIERSRLIVHLCHRDDWDKAQADGKYIAASLKQEGFIHCSTPEQILWVANTFYKGGIDFILMWIDPSMITSEIHWELAEGTYFPHIYGPINLSAVVAITPLEAKEDGRFHHLQGPG